MKKRIKKELTVEKKKTTAVAKKNSQKFKPKKPKKKMKRILFESDTDTSMSEDDICEDVSEDDISLTEVGKDTCFYCEETGKDDELWYRCTSCGLWAHSDCSGWDTPEGYLCDICSRKSIN